MTQVLMSLFDIARLRRDPSILPASLTLVVILAVAFAASSALQSWMLYQGDRLLARTVADLAMTFAAFWLVLAVSHQLHRFRQTMSAVLGTSVLLTPLLVLLIGLQQPAEMFYAVKLVAWAGLLGATVWITLIVAHILKSALEVGLMTSIAIAITFLVATTVLTGRLFPAAA
jgi:hypothetical protein